MVDQRLTDMNADQTWERPTKVCRFCLHFASLPARDAVPLPADPSHARRALHRLAQRPSCAEAVSRRGLDRTCTSKDQKRWPRSIQWASVLLQSSGCRERFLRQSSIGVDGRLGLICLPIQIVAVRGRHSDESWILFPLDSPCLIIGPLI